MSDNKVKTFFVKLWLAIKSFFVLAGAKTKGLCLRFAAFVKGLPAYFKSLPKRAKLFIKSDDGKKAVFELIRTVAVVALALVVAIVIIVCASDMPGESVKVFLTSQFSSAFNFSRMLTESVPLIFTGVAVCIMVRCGQFNMMGEGCFFTGALFGALLGAVLKVPPFLATLLALLIPTALTGAVGYVPAKLKASLKVNELVSSLMMNFVMFWVCMFLLYNKFADPDFSSVATPIIPDGVKLPFLSADTELSSSFILALVVALAAYIFLAKTKFGYALRMTGDNERFAAYSGIKTKSAIVYSQVIGSGLAGFGGAAFMLGNFYRFSWKALPNYGFDGFIVAIMARNKPLLVPFIALLFGYMRAGAMEMSVLTDVPNEIIFIVQAVMILLVGAHAFYEYMRKYSAKKRAARVGGTSGGGAQNGAPAAPAKAEADSADKEGKNA